MVGDYCHHEQKIEAEGPEDEKFGAFEVAAWDVVLFGADELIVFEGGEDEGLVGGGEMGGVGVFVIGVGVSRELKFVNDGTRKRRAALDWTAEGGCPHIVHPL